MADAPIDALQVLQRGKEVTAGTSVDATHRVDYVEGSLDFDHGYDDFRRRYAGSLATSHGSYLGVQRPTLSYRERVTYDHIVALLSMSVEGGITGSGGAADKTWATIAPSDTADNLNRWTYEVGGTDTWPEDEEFKGCVADEIEFSWTKSDSQPVIANVSLLAMRNVVAAKTAAQTIPSTFVPILGRFARVYIDSATIGSTSYSRAISGSLSIGLGMSQRFGADGTDYPSSVRVTGPRDVRLNLMVEYDSTTLRTARTAQTLQKIRLEFPGPALGGTAYNWRTDFYGKFTATPIGSDGGVKVLNVQTIGEYDSSTTAEFVMTVVNSLTALP